MPHLPNRFFRCQPPPFSQIALRTKFCVGRSYVNYVVLAFSGRAALLERF